MSFRVLVVEDDATNMQIIGMNLAMLGYEVIEAHDPELGQQLARREQPDVILMDMRFKGSTIDGIEAIRRLKAEPATAGIPVVALTASVLEYLAVEVRAVGAAILLHKPFRRKELLEALLFAAPHAPAPLARLRAAGPGRACRAGAPALAPGLPPCACVTPPLAPLD